jgi:Bacterial PH domain
MSAVFRSKVDGRFGWAAVAMPGVALLALFTAPARNPLLWIPVVMVLLAAVLVCWIFVATYYELRGDELMVRCGPFTWVIPVSQVTAIRDSRSTRSGPALSMDRVEIVYGGGRVLIVSPADKARFMAILSRRTAALTSSAAGPKPEP